jgi:hypothetical protein
MYKISKIWVVVACGLLLVACGSPASSDQDKKIQSERPIPAPKIWSLLTSSMKQVVVKQIYVTPDSTFIEVQTTGFEERNFFETIGGVDPIIKAFNMDLDEDGYDEIYLITQSRDKYKFGNVIGFNSNRDKSLSMINIPQLDVTDPLFEGYSGRDEFSVQENRLVRFFPIDESQADLRVFYYLYPGEAMMQLGIEKVENVTD